MTVAEALVSPWYPPAALAGRVPLRWSSGRPLAVAPVVVVEHYENVPPDGSVTAADVFGGVGAGSAVRPQIPRIGNRDYGHRVGFFRLAELFADLDLPMTVAIDAMAAERHPAIVRTVTEAGWDVVCHGIAVTRAVTEAMDAAAERDYVAQAKDRVEQAVGRSVTGWLGPSSSESSRSPQILAEAGFTFCADRPNDDQPYWLATTPTLLAVPTLAELDDSTAMLARGLTAERYYAALGLAAGRLADEATGAVPAGADTAGAVMAWPVHAWVSGQPWRFAHLRRALTALRADDRCWCTDLGTVAVEAAAQLSSPGPTPPATPSPSAAPLPLEEPS